MNEFLLANINLAMAKKPLLDALEDASSEAEVLDICKRYVDKRIPALPTSPVPMFPDIPDWKPIRYIDSGRIKTLHHNFSIPEDLLHESRNGGRDNLKEFIKLNVCRIGDKIYDDRLYDIRTSPTRGSWYTNYHNYEITIGVLDPNENV